MENMDENYFKLTIKTFSMLKWFQNNCPSSPYFIKVDDDAVKITKRFPDGRATPRDE